MKKLGLLVATFFFSVFASITQSHSDTVAKGIISKSIVGGKGWVVTTSPGPDCPAANCLAWTTTNYNDSAWVTPTLTDNSGGITFVDDVLPGTKAKFMWHPSASTVAYFRYKFTLDATSQTLPLSAGAFVGADDFYELWVNGNFVASGLLSEHVQGPDWFPQSVDLTPYLQSGQNVIAIRANDGDCKTHDPLTGLCSHAPFAADGTYSGDAFSRSFRQLFFDGKVISVEGREDFDRDGGKDGHDQGH